MIRKCGGAVSLVCAALLLAASQAAAQDKKTLTISSWGGAFQKAQKEAWFGIVEKELGVVIKEDNTSGIADVRTQVASGKPTWDLTTQGAYSCALLEKEGRLEKFDDATMKALADIPKTLGRSEHCAPQIVYSVAIGWRDKAYPGKEPPGWAAFWDTKNFPGQRSIRKHPIYALEMALIADGVPMDKLYPIDVDRAFKKLEQLKPHVLVWWSSGAQSAQVLKDGEVDMVAAWNGRIQALENEPEGRGGKIKTTFNQQILVSDSWMIPKGAPNRELALKAIAIMSRPEVNARIANYINYAPSNIKAYDTGVIPKEKLPGLPNSPGNFEKGFVQDVSWWVANADAMVKRFDAFLQR
ncbi:ABC transporter substrate-binding protein [Reyranella sp.]|uniref:ABC transporter substrate-binding protein n=1 Tax=Reyranella sp. TaxID=1929291 RepID=UPI003D0CF255